MSDAPIDILTIRDLRNDENVPGLLAALERPEVSADRTLRFAAVDALKKTRSRHALAPFVRLLDDDDRLVRHLAIEGLGQIGDPVAVPALVARLRDDAYGLRVQAAKALGAIGGDDAIRGLLELGMEDHASVVRRVSARSLGALQSRAALPRLVAALSEPSDVRSDAAVALIRIRDERAVDALCVYWASIGPIRRWAIRLELFGYELPLPGYLVHDG